MDTPSTSKAHEGKPVQVVKISRKNQYLGSFFILLLPFFNGSLIGWNSPCFPVLESNQTPLLYGPLNIDESSWIISSMSSSSLLGTFYYIWMVNNCGTKVTAYCIAFLQIIAWFLINMATHPYYLFASKLLNGFSHSGIFIICPIFISEISDTRVRGFLGSMLGLSGNIGILFAFVCGTFIECLTVPWIFLPMTLVFLISFAFFPETPYFFALRGKYMKAENSLRFYRGIPEDVRNDEITYEIGTLKNISFESAERNCKTKIKFQDFTSKSFRRSLTIGIMLCIIQQLSGCFAMINYTSSMFEDSGSSLSPNLSSIVVGVIQVLGSYASTLLVERVGRKILMMMSAMGTGLSLGIFATFSYLVDHPDFKNDFTQFKSIPLITFSLALFFANCGILNLPFLILAEVLPLKIKAFGTIVCYSVWNVMSFLVVKYLPIVMENYGMYVPVYAFTIVCFVGCIFIYLHQVETKGKTFNEIFELLEK